MWRLTVFFQVKQLYSQNTILGSYLSLYTTTTGFKSIAFNLNSRDFTEVLLF